MRSVHASTVGGRLAHARRRAGYSQMTLAAEAGCSASLISKIERGVVEISQSGATPASPQRAPATSGRGSA